MAHIDTNLMQTIAIADPVYARSTGVSDFVSVNPSYIGFSKATYLNLELSDRHRYCEIKKVRYPFHGKESVCVCFHFTANKERYSWYVTNGKRQYKASINSKSAVQSFFGNIEKTKRFEEMIIDPDQKMVIVLISRYGGQDDTTEERKTE